MRTEVCVEPAGGNPDLSPSRCTNMPTDVTRQKGEIHKCRTSERSLKQRQRHETIREKDRFLIFTRILVKLLEQTDIAMHYEVRDAIRDCTERKARKEPGYESATNVLRERIRDIVNEETWKRTELYLERYLKQEKSLQRSSSFHRSRKGYISSNASTSTTSSQYSCPFDGSMSVISRFSVDTAATDDSCSLASNSPFQSNWHSYSSCHPPSSPGDSISTHSHSNHRQLTHEPSMRAGAAAISNATGSQGRCRPPSYPGAVVIPVSASKARKSAQSEQDHFVVLMRFLLKILKEKDPDGLLVQNVQDVVQDCIARNQRNEPGYENVKSIVRERLEVIVPAEYWDAAKQEHEDHDHSLQFKNR
jgi:hypothetical protein